MIGFAWLLVCYVGNGLMDLVFGPEGEHADYVSRTVSLDGDA